MAEQELQGLVVMDNEPYHQAAGISKSHLDEVARSPRHYWNRYLNPNYRRPEPTEAMRLGSAIHAAMLEPDVFAKQYCMRPPGIDLRTTIGKQRFAAFEAENLGKDILKEDDHRLCMDLAKALRDHPVAGPLFSDGKSEQCYFATDPETGALVKCKPDWQIDNGMMVDLKSTTDASPSTFSRDVAKYRYFVQSPWYKDVHKILYGELPPFVFVAIEKEEPYAIGVYYLDATDEQFGRNIARRDLARILECKAANAWPDFGTIEAMPVKMPAWIRSAA